MTESENFSSLEPFCIKKNPFMKNLISVCLIFLFFSCNQQNEVNSNVELAQKVNVFLGTSGDHGQMSPAASYPFSMMSIGPQTNPHIHAGYEYYAKDFDGFTHTRLEGVGCVGSGGNILIKPILDSDKETKLVKKTEKAEPGFYSVAFENGINVSMAVKHNFGMEQYHFPNENSGLYVDLAYAFAGRFVAEEHIIKENTISGWVDTKTTCSAGIYRIYYALQFQDINSIKEIDTHQYLITGKTNAIDVKIGFSSVNENYASERIEEISFNDLKEESSEAWNKLLSKIKVKGEQDREALFYSLLYRGLHSPYLISEEDGMFMSTNGSIQKSDFNVYNGWAIWDNYREQLPMLSLFYSEKYGNISKSIANLYKYGKNNWATNHEPSLTVRTEHALVVLLDSYNKGYDINFEEIKDSLIKEADNLDYSAPDKALESSYDNWAMAEILKIMGDTELCKVYESRALEYKKYWEKDFKDLERNDVDRMQARGLYQGTIWQYRWFVPFDVQGLKKIAGGEEAFVSQLDQFFEGYYYNHANQPDLQVPGMYNATKEPWKSQKLYRSILLDTVVQTYFNDNSKGIDPYIGRIYKNQPKAYLRTMDDDAGTMSSWFVMRSIGLSPANIGNPVYYLTAPVFEEINIDLENGKSFHIKVRNYNKDNFYIQSVILNGEPLERNWLTQQEIINGGELIIETTLEPNKEWGIKDQWISSFKESCGEN